MSSGSSTSGSTTTLDGSLATTRGLEERRRARNDALLGALLDTGTWPQNLQ